MKNQKEIIKNKENKKFNVNLITKSNTKGITLISLVVTIVVLLILAGITIATLFGENGIIKKAREAKEETSSSQENELGGVDNLGNQMLGVLGEQNKLGYNKEEGMNSPKIKGEMVPVKWNEAEKAWYVCDSKNTNKEWYDYENRLWANIMMRDGLVLDNGTETGLEITKETKLEDMIGKKVKEIGSMFVWIPRYAYNMESVKPTIETTTDPETGATTTTVTDPGRGYHTNVAGEIKVVFLQGNTDIPAVNKIGNEEIKIVEYNETTTENYTKFPDGYVVHPAFKYGSHLAGLWVAKFEASKQGATTDTTNENSTNNDKADIPIQVKPSVTSLRYIKVLNIYTVCINYKTELNSHQMKNTEWGAVAYFSHSKYGRNGTEISQNQCSTYITGAGPGLGESTISNTKYDYDETNFESTYSYTTAQGKLASSTGNVTGIYDLSGGANDRVAAYLTIYTDFSNKDAKTVDLYKVGNPNDELNNYEANKDKYGDAVWETSNKETGSGSWNGDGSTFPNGTINYCFRRGGDASISDVNAGLFYFSKFRMNGTGTLSFRPVLAVL